VERIQKTEYLGWKEILNAGWKSAPLRKKWDRANPRLARFAQMSGQTHQSAVEFGDGDRRCALLTRYLSGAMRLRAGQARVDLSIDPGDELNFLTKCTEETN